MYVPLRWQILPAGRRSPRRHQAEKVTVLRERFAHAGLAGIATAELRVDLKTLPLRDGVANLVMVDAGRADRPSHEELLRVMAPGATLWVREATGYRQLQHQPGPCSREAASRCPVYDRRSG